MSRVMHWINFFLILPFAAFATQAAGGELVAQTDIYEVRLLGHQDHDHSVLHNRTVREYLFEVTSKLDEQEILISLGGNFLAATEELQKIRIFEDLMIVTTHTHIFTLDLRSGEPLKFLRVLDPTFSNSGRFLAYREWQVRWMPEEMQGAVVSLLDLKNLKRRVVFPESENLRESRRSDPSGRFEPYFTTWEEDPRRRCFTSKLVWSPNDSRLAFLCHYYLTVEGWRPERHDRREYEVVVVHLGTDLKVSALQHFDIPDKVFRIPGVQIDASQGVLLIQDADWLDEDFFEIRLRPKPWLRERLVIDLTKDEIRFEPES